MPGVPVICFSTNLLVNSLVLFPSAPVTRVLTFFSWPVNGCIFAIDKNRKRTRTSFLLLAAGGSAECSCVKCSGKLVQG